MFRKGLVLGKFYPFHNGHKFLIETAKSQCETVIVLLCSLPTEEISGDERYEAIKAEITDPAIQIVHVDMVMPQYPKDDPDFWNKWVSLVRNRVSDLDVMFTSEIYGDEFARRLGIQHVQLPIDRRDVPTSGTAVRTDPFEQWHLLPRASMTSFIKKICLVGPESVGKTTFAEKLANHYGCRWVPEYGRTYTDMICRGKFCADDFLTIALMHNKLIQNELRDAASLGHKYIFFDTDATTTVVFSELYEKYHGIPQNPKHRDIFIDLMNQQEFDLYLFLEPHVPWVDDGQRDFGEDDMRQAHSEYLREAIKLNVFSGGAKLVSISGGSFDWRMAQAITAVDSLTHPKT